MNHPATATTHAPASPSRRALLGAAVWSVPVVSLTTAAPAFASSGGAATPTRLSVTAASAQVTTVSGNNRTIKGTMVVHNPTAAATKNLQVVFTVPLGYLPSGGSPQPTLGSTNGPWTLAGFSQAVDHFTVTITAVNQLGAGNSTTIDFALTALLPGLAAGTPAVTVRPTATGLATDTFSFTPR